MALATKLSDDKKSNQNEKLSYVLKNLTPILKSCGLEQIATKSQVSSACITDLTEGLNLAHKIMTSTKQFSKAFGTSNLIP